MPSDQRNANEVTRSQTIAESLAAIEERLDDIDLRTVAMREAVDGFAENLITIHGQFMRIDKNLDDLKVILEILSRHIIKEKDDASKKPGATWEVDTWRPEKPVTAADSK
jgi:archaellum component FlaC